MQNVQKLVVQKKINQINQKLKMKQIVCEKNS